MEPTCIHSDWDSYVVMIELGFYPYNHILINQQIMIQQSLLIGSI